MHHKIIVTPLAVPLLCLLILAALWLTPPERVALRHAQASGQPPLANDSAPHTLSLLNRNNQLRSRSLSMPKGSSGGQNVELVGQIGGSSYAVAVEGNYAYVGVGPRLVILDISDSANPTMVGQTDVLPDIVQDVTIASSYAYVANREAGLRVINIANPQNPTEVGSYNTPGSAYGVTIAGSYAYLADGSSGLRVININNPQNPTEVGSVDTPGFARDVAIAGTHAYVADLDAGLRVINIKNPQTPTEVGSYDTPDHAYDVAIAGSYAYVADGNSGLRVININNPQQLTEVASYDTPGGAYDVAIAGSYAYVADGFSGLRVINIKNPVQPTEIGSYDTPGFADGVTIAGSYAYVADGSSGLRVINITNPAQPTEVGYYQTPGSAWDVAIAGSYAYVADAFSGLRVINIKNPQTPTKVGSYDTPRYAYGVAIAGSYAYVANSSRGLRVINITNPAQPTEVGYYQTPGSARDVAIAGSYAYVADGSHGLRVININNPEQPTEVGSYDTPGDARDVAIAGSYAYVADESSGLRVININNPQSPTEVGFFDTPGDARDVAIAGSYAYVADYNQGLRVINIKNPQTPTEVGYYQTPRYAYGVAIAGSYAYVADYNQGLRVINITNPAQPTEVGYYQTPGWAYGVAIAGSYIYVADTSGGLVILRFTGETMPTPTATNTPSATNIPTVTNAPPTTQTNTPTASNTPSATATHTPLPSNTPAATATHTSTAGDAYEPDDTCAQASSIPTDGTIQAHTFHAQNDQDWVAFEGTAGVEYAIQARVPSGSAADVIMEVYGVCGTVVDPGQDPSFSPDIRLKFEAPTTGTYHLHLLNHDPNKYGADVSYSLSVRALDRTGSPGALVVVAGRLYDDDERDLQANIQHVTNTVYGLFRAKGYPPQRIHYLATDLNIDATGDNISDVSALASKAQLQHAITQWTADKELGPERAFTLYLMDHGGENGIFYLDNPRGERVTAQELDAWLTQMEVSNPGVKVNIIIEACYSGSFLNRLASSGRSSGRQNGLLRVLGGANRVLITSTDPVALAYASPQGAWFSDSLLDALAQDMSLAEAFEEASRSVLQANPAQLPLLEGNGDGFPNRIEDYQAAAQRGFAIPGSFADNKWAPYIKQSGIRNINNGQAEIWAEVEDDEQQITGVWAVVQPPSYQPTSQDGELVSSLLPENLFAQGNNQYAVRSSSFDEQGTYRVIIYAQDAENLQARPVVIEMQIGEQALYLPLLIR